MKVLLLNGSPHEHGCTYTALTVVANEISAQGIDTKIFWIGSAPVRGCTGCAACIKAKSRRCIYNDDPVNSFLEKAEEADGFIFGSPVHYAAATGAITSFLDRCFYGKPVMAYKPGAAVVCCRRGGGTAAFEQLNKYFTISSMPVVSSQYWNTVHGTTPEEVMRDSEGLQIMRTLGRNMAWLLKSIEAGKTAGIELPENEPRINTNFIR